MSKLLENIIRSVLLERKKSKLVLNQLSRKQWTVMKEVGAISGFVVKNIISKKQLNVKTATKIDGGDIQVAINHKYNIINWLNDRILMPAQDRDSQVQQTTLGNDLESETFKNQKLNSLLTKDNIVLMGNVPISESKISIVFWIFSKTEFYKNSEPKNDELKEKYERWKAGNFNDTIYFDEVGVMDSRFKLRDSQLMEWDSYIQKFKPVNPLWDKINQGVENDVTTIIKKRKLDKYRENIENDTWPKLVIDQIFYNMDDIVFNIINDDDLQLQPPFPRADHLYTYNIWNSVSKWKTEIIANSSIIDSPDKNITLKYSDDYTCRNKDDIKQIKKLNSIIKVQKIGPVLKPIAEQSVFHVDKWLELQNKRDNDYINKYKKTLGNHYKNRVKKVNAEYMDAINNKPTDEVIPRYYEGLSKETFKKIYSPPDMMHVYDDLANNKIKTKYRSIIASTNIKYLDNLADLMPNLQWQASIDIDCTANTRDRIANTVYNEKLYTDRAHITTSTSIDDYRTIFHDEEKAAGEGTNTIKTPNDDKVIDVIDP